MLPKEIRDKKVFAKKCAVSAKQIIKQMDAYLGCSNPKYIEVAEAFYRVLAYHIAEGDLHPSNVHLAALLRRDKGDFDE